MLLRTTLRDSMGIRQFSEDVHAQPNLLLQMILLQNSCSGKTLFWLKSQYFSAMRMAKCSDNNLNLNLNVRLGLHGSEIGLEWDQLDVTIATCNAITTEVFTCIWCRKNRSLPPMTSLHKWPNNAILYYSADSFLQRWWIRNHSHGRMNIWVDY